MLQSPVRWKCQLEGKLCNINTHANIFLIYDLWFLKTMCTVLLRFFLGGGLCDIPANISQQVSTSDATSATFATKYLRIPKIFDSLVQLLPHIIIPMINLFWMIHMKFDTLHIIGGGRCQTLWLRNWTYAPCRPSGVPSVAPSHMFYWPQVG